MVFRTVRGADWRKEKDEVAVWVDGVWQLLLFRTAGWCRLVLRRGWRRVTSPQVSGCGLAYGRLGGGVLLRRWSAEGWRRHMGSNESLSDPGAAGRQGVCVGSVRCEVWRRSVEACKVRGVGWVLMCVECEVAAGVRAEPARSGIGVTVH